MAEGTPAVSVLPSEFKMPSSTGTSTASYVEKGVSDVTNMNNSTNRLVITGEGRNNNNNYNDNSSGGYRTTNPYSNSNSNNQYYSSFNQYNSSNNNNYYGGHNNNSYNRDYNNNYGGTFNSNSNNNNSNTGYGNNYTNNNSTPTATDVGDGSVVDSALLAALRDSRERVALLRLEQVMIDFMNAPEGYVEVGGAYNSVVVSPNTSNKRFQSAASMTDTGGRQTSFQRCLLHRLADRFGIVRESGTILEGSIRLIKKKESKIPKMLLLDHVEETNNSASSQGEADGGPIMADDSRSSQQPASAPAAKDKTKRKMKIMKRNSSADSNSGQPKSTPRSRKNKNFSDKEKAYAEARARIFADEANNDSVNNNSTANSVQSQSAPSSGAPSPSATPPPTANNKNDDSINNSSQANGNGAAPSTSASSSSTTAATPPVHKSSSTNSLNIPRRKSSSSLAGDVDDANNLPPAASSGVSKATWRNRREEENDPDFQRGAGLQAMVPAAASPSAAYAVPMVTGNAYYYGGPSSATTSVGAGATTYPPAHLHHQHHPQAYYGGSGGCGGPPDYSSIPGRGGVGGRVPASGRGFVTPRGYGYSQQPPQPYRGSATTGKTTTTSTTGEATNVNCMEEFPALR